MAPASTASREATPNTSHTNPAYPPSSRSTNNTGRPVPARPSRMASDLPDSMISRAPLTEASGALPLRRAGSPSDDEILGLPIAAELDSAPSNSIVIPRSEATRNLSSDDAREIADPQERTQDDDAAAEPHATNPAAVPDELRATLDANPDLRRAWDDAQSYRETFASPEEARTASALLADLDRMDALFFSRRPEDHAELARAVASLDPAAFASLAQAMAGLAAESESHRDNRAGNRAVSSAPPDSPVIPRSEATRNLSSDAEREIPRAARDDKAMAVAAPTAAQTEFFHATNAAAVQSVLASIESQVERLLPEGVSKSARNRVVGEIYRELDSTLRSNRQLAQQMRDAFRSGALDADHQLALVSLVTGRARQALPGVAKRVLNEWTSTLVAANNDRRTRQRAAEHRVDIAGSSRTGSDGSRSMTPRDIDYRRMSDSDILNL
jgi:hypothetical protein